MRLATLVAGAPCSLGLAWMRSAVRAPSQVSPRDPRPQGLIIKGETLRLGRLAVRQLRLHVHMQLDFSGVVGIRERPRGSQPFGETQLVQARHRGQKRGGAVVHCRGRERVRVDLSRATQLEELLWADVRTCRATHATGIDRAQTNDRKRSQQNGQRASCTAPCAQPGAARTAEIRQASRLASSRVRLRWGGARDCGVKPGSSRAARLDVLERNSASGRRGDFAVRPTAVSVNASPSYGTYTHWQDPLSIAVIVIQSI